MWASDEGLRRRLVGAHLLVAILLGNIPASAVDDGGCSRVPGATRATARAAVQPIFAAGFEVEYHETFKLVTVVKPWNGAEQPIRYLLLDRGATDPAGYLDAQRISIPVRRVMSLSTTHLPHFELLEVLPSLVAVASIDQVNSAAVRRQHKDGRIAEVGSGQLLDLEKVLELGPDLVLTDADSRARFNSHPALERAGVPVAITAEYLEGSILGRAEWLLFTSLFFDLEEQAQELVANISARYEQLSELVSAVPAAERPTVFGGALWGDVWHVAGGRSFPAQLITDAGGNYLWNDEPTRGSVPLDFEVVFDRASGADYWLPAQNGWFSLSDAIDADHRYGAFAAVENRRVFNSNARVNGTGGNDYWERALVEPDVVLADLIHIFHPRLLPDHQLRYLRRLE